jgi:CBS domain-containing protein
VLTIDAQASVLDAAIRMNEHKVGSLVVLGGGDVVGMFTERDVLQRIVAAQRDPALTPISEVMTVEIVCCTPDTSIEEARGVMKNRRIRHLPVLDGNRRLLGMISIGDLNAHQTTSQEQTIYFLHEYLYGRA